VTVDASLACEIAFLPARDGFGPGGAFLPCHVAPSRRKQMPGLSVSDVVNVQVNMSPLAVPLRNFGAQLFAGASPVIDVKERLREYTTLNDVVDDFGSAAPEYLAADLFFSQSPQPSILYLGRFAQTATQAVLHGKIFSTGQQVTLMQQLLGVTNGSMQITVDGTVRTASATAAYLNGGVFSSANQSTLLTTLKGITGGAFYISLDSTLRQVNRTAGLINGGATTTGNQPALLTSLQAITAGGFAMTIDGTVRQVGPINFSGAASLTGCATLIDTALGTWANCAWNATAGLFQISSATSGAASTVTYASAPATGTDVSATLKLTSASGASAPVAGAAAGINFSQINALGDAAVLIDTSLAGWGHCTWDPVLGRFVVSSITTGVASAISYAAPPTGTPINTTTTASVAVGQTVIPVTSVTGMANGMPISATGIPAGATIASIASLNVTIDSGHATTGIVASGAAVTVLPPGAGTDLSAPLQLTAATGASAPVNGATGMNFSGITNLNGAASIIQAALTGAGCIWDGTRFHISSLSSGPASTLSYASQAGTGTDISLMTGLSLAGGATAPVNGVAAETPLACAAALRAHPEWYGLQFALATDITQSDYLAVATFIEGANPSSIFGYTTQNTNVLDPTVTTDIASSMQGLNLERTYGQYSSSSPYASASMVARAFTVDFEASNTTITLKFKQEPGVQGEQLTENQAATLQSKNCNVFVYYSNNVAIIQEGVMANGFYFDEVHGTDWQANRIQTDLFNVLYQAPTKIPQTNPGIHILVTTVTASLNQGVVNGLIAPGQWNAPGFGQLATGQLLPSGFYVWAPLVESQPQAIREQRIAPTIQAAIKLAGAVHKANVIVNVNR
jgi:hypothetical protein